MEKAKANIVAKFCISQPFYNEYDVYYYDDFDDYLNLSQVVINDTVPLTPSGTDAISDETNDSVHTIKEVVKDPDVEVIIYLAPEGLATLMVALAIDVPSTMDGLFTTNPSLFDAPSS